MHPNEYEIRHDASAWTAEAWLLYAETAARAECPGEAMIGCFLAGAASNDGRI